ncbi:hypothetical protein AGMMS49545_23260 [Betaproteobacteria bacterium]|nr:hypothetical protein AGMMS49545_23260 [Betaproteobacteria bacterium]GHU47878.1 hypothetical protein AGMMS50289_23710 [Betaproteobacteria bacterium]
MKISNSGEIFDYLQDGFLRVKQMGKQRITIKNFDFSGERFDGSWGYFDFVDCDFSSAHTIQLDWLINCTFTDCRFRGNFGFGQTLDVRFVRCNIEGESHLGFDWESKNLIFEECKFTNPNSDPNHMGSILSGNEVMFMGCKTRNIAWGGDKKLTLKNCIVSNGSLDTASPAMYSDKSKMPYSDFLIEDCDLRGGAEMINARLQSFTMRRCKLRTFALQGSVIRGDALFEDIKEGFLRAAADYQGKLIVRNCDFLGNGGEEYSFECSGDTPTHTLLENLTCGRKPIDIIRQRKPITKWDDPPPNKQIVIKNCKIPHLRADWAQTEHLRIENCELGEVYIRDGRIGKLEIIGCSLMKLDVSRTQVKEQDVRVREGGKISGHVTVTEGSNIKLLPR